MIYAVLICLLTIVILLVFVARLMSSIDNRAASAYELLVSIDKAIWSIERNSYKGID